MYTIDIEKQIKEDDHEWERERERENKKKSADVDFFLLYLPHCNQLYFYVF